MKKVRFIFEDCGEVFLEIIENFPDDVVAFAVDRKMWDYALEIARRREIEELTFEWEEVKESES